MGLVHGLPNPGSIGAIRSARIIVAALILLCAQQSFAVECGSTANRAGCVGPSGATVYNKNTGTVQTRQPYTQGQPAPGTTVEGSRGNTVTRAVRPDCAYVNGQRVCR